MISTVAGRIASCMTHRRVNHGRSRKSPKPDHKGNARSGNPYELSVTLSAAQCRPAVTARRFLPMDCTLLSNARSTFGVKLASQAMLFHGPRVDFLPQSHLMSFFGVHPLVNTNRTDPKAACRMVGEKKKGKGTILGTTQLLTNCR